jgi:hypothetical protein
VNGMGEEVTTFRVRFTLQSGAFFRKRFLESGRRGDLAMAFCIVNFCTVAPKRIQPGSKRKSLRQNAATTRYRRAPPRRRSRPG